MPSSSDTSENFLCEQWNILPTLPQPGAAVGPIAEAAMVPLDKRHDSLETPLSSEHCSGSFVIGSARGGRIAQLAAAEVVLEAGRRLPDVME